MSYATDDSSLLASGTWGTCKWEIDADGVLTVHPGVGAHTDFLIPAPWANYKSKITGVLIRSEDGKMVQVPETCTDLFNSCRHMTVADLSGLDTSKAVDLSNMFYECSSLTYLNLSGPGWDTSNLVNTSCMFYGCSSLIALNIKSWDNSKVYLCDWMYVGCTSLASITVGPKYACKDPYLFPEPTNDAGVWCYSGEGKNQRGYTIASLLFKKYMPGTWLSAKPQ